MSVAGEFQADGPWLCPGFGIVTAEHDLGKLAAAIFSKKDGHGLPIWAGNVAWLAEVDFGALPNGVRFGPRESTIAGERLIEVEGISGPLGVFEKATIVVEHRPVPPIGKASKRPHDDDSAPVSDWLQWRPRLPIVFGVGESGRVEARPQDETFLARFRVDSAVNGWSFEGGFPVFGGWETV